MSIQLYKRANSKAAGERDSKDPKSQKWNASAVCVKIGNEFIPVSELQKLAKLNKKTGFVAIERVENEMEIDGETHDMGAMIELYRSTRQNADDNSSDNDPALQAAIKGMKRYDSKGNELAQAVPDNEDEALEKAKKNAEDDGEEEVEKGEKMGKEKTVVETKNKKMKGNDSDEGMVKDTGKKQNEEDDEDMKENGEDEDDEVKESIKKQSKANGKGDQKDVRHFLRMNSARENGTADAGVLTIDTMHNRVDRGRNRYGSDQ